MPNFCLEHLSEEFETKIGHSGLKHSPKVFAALHTAGKSNNDDKKVGVYDGKDFA